MKRMIRMYEDYMYHENLYNKPPNNNLKYDKKDIERNNNKDIEQSDKDIEQSDKILEKNNKKNDL